LLRRIGTVPDALQVVFEVIARKMRMRAGAEKSLELATKCGKINAGRATLGEAFSSCILTDPFDTSRLRVSGPQSSRTLVRTDMIDFDLKVLNRRLRP
jgi:hypothetical protein